MARPGGKTAAKFIDLPFPPRDFLPTVCVSGFFVFPKTAPTDFGINEETSMNGLQPAATNRVSSRVEADIEQMKTLTLHVDNIADRIIRHARALGYYQPTPETASVAPTPVITTLADALQALSRAVDYCSGSLNVFE